MMGARIEPVPPIKVNTLLMILSKYPGSYSGYIFKATSFYSGTVGTIEKPIILPYRAYPSNMMTILSYKPIRVEQPRTSNASD